MAGHRLIACVTPEGERWAYSYDPFGRRIFKINASLARIAAKALGIILPNEGLPGAFSEERRLPPGLSKDGHAARVGIAYSWDGHNLAEEAPLLLDGTIQWDEATRWHYEPDSFRPLAKETSDGKLLYIVTDHLGTPREMFSEDGKVQWAAEYRTWGSVKRLWRVDPDNDNLPKRADFDPKEVIPRSTGYGRSGVAYGNLALKDDPIWQEATLQCPIRFQGQWEDQETGLYYNRFRYYDPLAGSYMSTDPLGLQAGIRAHGYVCVSVKYIDPLGLQTLFTPNGSNGGAWRNLTTGQYALPPISPEQILKNGMMDYPSLNQWAAKNSLQNTWSASADLQNGFKYQWSDGTYNYQLWGHGANPTAPPGSFSNQNPTTSMSRKPCCGGKLEKLMDTGTWGARAPSPSNHIPLPNSPF